MSPDTCVVLPAGTTLSFTQVVKQSAASPCPVAKLASDPMVVRTWWMSSSVVLVCMDRETLIIRPSNTIRDFSDVGPADALIDVSDLV
jgi:hypothetical protein